MAPFKLETCARATILNLEPYRCARDDYKDDGTRILLDANENAFGPSLPFGPLGAPGASAGNGGRDAMLDDLNLAALHRYPDPRQTALKELICRLRNPQTQALAQTLPALTPDNLFVGVGSDEAIDALIRCFCVPGQDSILVCPPTYGMYAVAAQINDVSLVKVPLLPAPGFGVDVPAVMSSLDHTPSGRIKIIYLCSPGNPTGALLARSDIAAVLAHPTWNGVVVVDEAYIDFAADPASSSLAPLCASHPNLVVLQTLSKAFGLAAIRLGFAFCARPVAALLNALKAPYNISSPTAHLASAALSPDGLSLMRAHVASAHVQRTRLLATLPLVPGVGRLRGGADANFLLFEILGPDGRPDNPTALAVYERLAESRGVVVRFRGREHGCLGCLRFTVGTGDETTKLLERLRAVLADLRGTGAAAAARVEATAELVAQDACVHVVKLGSGR